MIRINFLVIKFLILILIFAHHFSGFSTELKEPEKIKNKASLKELPPEILWKIVLLLDKKSKYEFSAVSKRFLSFFPSERKKVFLEKLEQFCKYVSKAPLKERLKKIKIYSLSEINKIQKIRKLITIVENCPLLQELDLIDFKTSINNNEEEYLKLIELIEKLKNAKSLTALKLNNSIFHRNYKNFNSFSSLKILSIDSTSIGYSLNNSNFLDLCSNFTYLKKLEVLEIADSYFIKLEGIKELKNSLKRFHLKHNFYIPDEEFRYLEYLENLEECFIRGTNIMTFPNLSKLKKLKKNNFTYVS